MASKLLRSRTLIGWVFPLMILGGLTVATRWSMSAPPESSTENNSPPKVPADSKAALASFNELIGGWRGVGMPRRGSNVGAWFETADWVWDFKEKTPAIKYDVKQSQLLKSARLTWNPAQKQFQLKAILPDDSTREYQGKLSDAKKLVLESPADEAGQSHRITITQLNEKRTLVLHEKRTGQGSYRRVAEVGYTRAGTSLAVEGAGELECVVTGGKGTMAVSLPGQNLLRLLQRLQASLRR